MYIGFEKLPHDSYLRIVAFHPQAERAPAGSQVINRKSRRHLY